LEIRLKMATRFNLNLRFALCVAGVLLPLLLAGCGSTAGKRRADGPPASGSEEATKNVELRAGEPLHRGANRPYTVLGKSYTPDVSGRPYKARGLASWYGSLFHGQRTASGEIFDMHQLTAAHTTLPIPSYARVTHAKSGEQVIVRVNDRGPFKDDRVIDLSYAAARRLGFANAGVAEVQVELLSSDEVEDLARGRAPAAPVPAPPQAQAPTSPAPTIPPPSVATPNSPPPAALSSSGFYAQLASFRDTAAARVFAARAAAVAPLASRVVEEVSGALTRVMAGPFASRAEAESAAAAAAKALGVEPLVTQRSRR
jgi:rare lipoprotein A